MTVKELKEVFKNTRIIIKGEGKCDYKVDTNEYDNHTVDKIATLKDCKILVYLKEEENES